ncbi:MAG TPA: ABC transporter permease [Elusimicrobiales bacterium]|nr:ABC transporter permease [Elusimicrobiales bacterium]
MMQAFLAVFRRECLRIVRNRHLRLICLASPFLYGVMLASVYAHKRINAVPVGLVDMDNSALSREAARRVDATENVDILRSYDTPAQAQDAVIRGEVHGFLYVPKDFSRDIKRGGEARLRVAADYANVVVANPVLMAASDAANDLSGELFTGLAARRGLVRRRAEDLTQLVRADVRPIFNPQMNYLDFFVPGLIFAVLQQIIIVGLAFTVTEERQKGRGAELYELSGGRPAALLAAKAAPYLLLNFAFSLFFIYGLLPFFDLRPQAGPAAVLGLTLLFVACTTAFGLVVSSCFRRTTDAFLALMFFSMPAFLVSGFSWPSYAMPWFVRAVALPIPTTHFMAWFRMTLGAPLPPGAQLRPALILAALGAFYAFSAWLILRRLYRRAGLA